MSFKWWLPLVLVLSACSSSDNPGPGQPGARPKPAGPDPALDAELRTREARELACELDGRIIKVNMPESGGRLAAYLTRLLVVNAPTWKAMSEEDGARLYRDCLRPELLALTQGDAK